MQHQINLRKLSAVNKEIQGVIRKQRREASDTSRVNIRAHQTELVDVTIANAVAARTALYESTLTLQGILSRFRAVVACKNNELGITATLQELRETEDRLSILSDFLVEPKKNPDYDGYSNIEDAKALIKLYEEADKNETTSRRVGKSEVNIRLLSEDSVAVEIKALQRKIKEIKNDRLVALNFVNVSVELTEQEKELLESFNIL